MLIAEVDFLMYVTIKLGSFIQRIHNTISALVDRIIDTYDLGTLFFTLGSGSSCPVGASR